MTGQHKDVHLQSRRFAVALALIGVPVVLVWQFLRVPMSGTQTELYFVHGPGAGASGTTTLAYAVRNRTGADRTYHVTGSVRDATGTGFVPMFVHDLFVRDGEVRVLTESYEAHVVGTSSVRIAIQEPTLVIHTTVPPPP
jgi:hypothetical protein